jgi:hypothetical protein
MDRKDMNYALKLHNGDTQQHELLNKGAQSCRDVVRSVQSIAGPNVKTTRRA